MKSVNRKVSARAQSDVYDRAARPYEDEYIRWIDHEGFWVVFELKELIERKCGRYDKLTALLLDHRTA